MEESAHHLDQVYTVMGTRRWLPSLVGEPSDLDWEQNKAFWKSWTYRRNILLNTPIQGSGADLVVWSTNRFMPLLPPSVEVINLVHDEVDALVTEATLKPTIKTITRAFQETFAKFYPQTDLVPQIRWSIGPSWGELQPIKSK
jgi:DNA polymerase I-like protein with 3'-5' exonuclease and polymerase domains